VATSVPPPIATSLDRRMSLVMLFRLLSATSKTTMLATRPPGSNACPA